MAAPMRSSSQDAGHRARVADSSRTGNATAKPDIATPTSQPPSSNFEYDDNEWDIGIGDLIIDLDADIEKTNEQPMAANAGGPQAQKAAAAAKMAVEHSATVDKGLKMKIKRTKPGTKTSEAKHEIVKSNELNGTTAAAASLAEQQQDAKGAQNATQQGSQGKHAASQAQGQGANSGNGKRGSSGHRRDKVREKHSSSSSTSSTSSSSSEKSASGKGSSAPPQSGAVTVSVSEMNGMVRVSAPQTGPPRSVFPASTGPGPPATGASGPSPGPPPSPAAATAQGSAAKPEQAKVQAQGASLQPSNNTNSNSTNFDECSSSPPPAKKLKTEPKDVSDVCVGTSVGTITEPDCLGPCEPGTSVTLEGIVWHETEGGVLVVNVTWRGKTYVGTLLDCTRHDWAPPRFCDSPTSDLDNRTPKGRETRSSVHSKLRNGGVKGRRGAAANGSGPSTAPSSPTPFVPPRPEPKRKGRAGEEDSPQPQTPAGKKAKVAVVVAAPAPAPATCGSPPPSPVLLECPEPNCSKKYKHINGLKYHQSHAHGSAAEDDDTKDVTSMSENDESNIEAPSPNTPVKSPEKAQDSPMTPKKEADMNLMLRGAGILEGGSQPATPRSTPPSPATPQSIQDTAGSPTVPIVDTKSVVKPGVLRFTPEEYPVGVFAQNKATSQGPPISASGPLPSVRPHSSESTTPMENAPPASFSNQIQSQVSQFQQHPSLIIPPSNQNLATSQMSPHPPQSPSQQQQQQQTKIPQFKVKPTAALMPEDKNKQHNVNNNNKAPQQQQQQQQQQQSFNSTSANINSGSSNSNNKKKIRKSPAGSPHPPSSEQPVFGVEQSGRDEVQSPAYSDISDDGAPVIEQDLVDKKSVDKKTESGQNMPHMPQYGMYPFYGQPQYLVPSVQDTNKVNNSKDGDKNQEKSLLVIDKDSNKKDSNSSNNTASDYQQKMMQQQHYYPYSYVTGYPYNMDPNFAPVPLVQEDKIKEERIKESPSPIIEQPLSKNAPIPNPIQVPTPGKIKNEPNSNNKDKHQNENHQILKESIEIKNQMNPYLYSRQQQQQQQSQQAHHNQRDEDVRRFYVYDQRRKEAEHKTSTPGKTAPPPSPSMKHKENKNDDSGGSNNVNSSASSNKKEKDIKQEGVKPTMETQGPPPPPTSQYAYIHPSYMQSPHYGPLAFDPMYRGIMVPGPYSGNPYLHAQIPRYHAPEDLSRAPPGPKALDMLQHHAQYYSSHKIHELQERAIKSPTPTKTSVASSSPSTNSGATQMTTAQGGQMTTALPPTSTSTTPSQGKQVAGDGKDSRSPPPQRHVHTHHHTHVGLGYPMYPAPYGAAVLASQQAAAVTVINPYPTK